MDNSEINKKDIKNTSKDYFEEDQSNSSINNSKNGDNNILSINETKDKLQNDVDNLKTVKIENSNNISNNDFTIPPELKKTYRMTIILTITGIILILCGIIKAVIMKRISGGIIFWILSILVLIPGGFYSYQFYRAKTTNKEYERQEIFDSIPRLQ